MEFTISELAEAVGKAEGYVRQHIHRKHLATRKQGRAVTIALDEAVRWADERGLVFTPPARTSVVSRETVGERAARWTMLVVREPDGTAQNLFTLLRHRRPTTLGPWVRDTHATWSRQELGHNLELHTLDTSLEHGLELVDQIVKTGTLERGEFTLRYALEPTPRQHWAYRESHPLTDASVKSPFSQHSAEIIEHWSFDRALRQRWLEILEAFRAEDVGTPKLGRLGFSLDHRSDRVGNLMISGAADALNCRLEAHHDHSLRLHVEAEEGVDPEAHTATVWASHSGDRVLRREVSLRRGQTRIELNSSVDHIGFAIHRRSDHQCVDLMDAVLIMDIGIQMKLQSSPALHLKDRKGGFTHVVRPAGLRSSTHVRGDAANAPLDQGIRRFWLDRQIYEREARARREGNFARYRPNEFTQAVAHFIRLLDCGDDGTAPLYLADPYFMHPLLGDKEAQLKGYLDIFSATAGRPLRILCTRRDPTPPPWWSKIPAVIKSHVKIRAFLEPVLNSDPGPGFHDRYVLTPDREILFTNSFNGWLKHGVTFASLPYGVYRIDAERLWSMPVDSLTTSLLVQEII